jgi:hypothetical protein
MRTFGADVLTIADALTDAYVEIFTAPPWSDRDPEETRARFHERLETDAHRAGFRAVASFADGYRGSSRAGSPRPRSAPTARTAG